MTALFVMLELAIHGIALSGIAYISALIYKGQILEAMATTVAIAFVIVTLGAAVSIVKSWLNK